MRGKANPLLTICICIGITPAHAGKRDRDHQSGWQREDHPRSCGEKQNADRHDHKNQGSPPLMRGKARCQAQRSQGQRITPAHAGKSSKRCPFRRCFEDHPRSCGEKESADLVSRSWRGSPPLMRGKDEAILPGKNADRITPAHAGKRKLKVDRRKTIWDHPRSCGEK